jgi:anthranilate phosphoribosyltransferase
MNIQTALQSILNNNNLSRADMRCVMRSILNGETSSAQIAGFLIALRCKGESVDEIIAATEVMRELVTPISITGKHMIDTCGTGGDGANTFNISTTCAFVVAAAGGTVTKHGNRSVSSSSGSADVLEAAGVDLNLSAEHLIQCVNEIGVGFLFAQKHHSSMRHVLAPRKEMGVRTLFNLLGPLANPAGAKNQLIGVFDQAWLMPLAKTLQVLGSKHVLIVSADDGLDELSIACASNVVELKKGALTRYQISPEQFGLKRSSLDSLVVNNAQDSLQILCSILDNQVGAALDIVVLNAGAAIYAADLVDNFEQGIKKAQEVIASGAAKEKFQALIAFKAPS